MRAASPPANPTRTVWPALILVFAVGAAMRLVALGHEGLWCDEAYTALVVRKPLLAMVRDLIRTDDAPPLYYFLERLVAALFGNSETALRSLSALAGCGAILLLLWRAARSGGPLHSRALFWSAAFLAIASYATFYARQARSYGIVMLLIFGIILAAQDLLLRDRRRAGPWLAVLGTLLLFTHHLGVLILLTSLALWPLRPATGLRLRRWLFWHAVPLLLWGCWWIVAGTQAGRHAALNTWMAAAWSDRSLLLAPLLSVGSFLPGVLSRAELAVAFPALPPAQTAWRWLSLGLVALLLLAPLRKRTPRALRAGQSSGPPPEQRAFWIELTFLVLPLLALALISATWAPSYVLARTDAIAFPAFVLLAGRGLARWPRGIALGCVIVWGAISLTSLAPTYGGGDRGTAKGSDRFVARFMTEHGLRAQDWVVHSFLTAPSLEYYLSRYGSHHHTAWFPEIAAANPAGVTPTPADSLEAYVLQARRLREAMERDLPPDGAAWILAVLDAASARADAGAGTWPAELTASALAYPSALLVHQLAGMKPLRPLLGYRQDWVGGDRVVLRIPRAEWVPVEQLGPVQFAGEPQSGPSDSTRRAGAAVSVREREEQP